MKLHECSWNNDKNFDENIGAYIIEDDKNPLLSVNIGMYENEKNAYIPIKYCPFCGKKLTSE